MTMSNKVRFRVGGNGASTLPVTGGEDVFRTPELADGYERIYFTIAFYGDSARENLTTPTTGTVEFTVIDDGVEMTVQGGKFNAADVNDVIQPAAMGNFESAKLKITGVDSGLYAYAIANQKGDENGS